MNYTAKIQPSGINFSVADNMTILESAIGSSIYLEHSCLNGNCGSCKSKLVKGELKAGSVVPTAGLTEAEIQDGYLLTCQAIPITDVELEADFYPELAEIKKSICPCKIESLNFVGDETLVLKLKLPPSTMFQYLAGQYIQLIINGERRSYSIANISDTYTGVELHIKKVENGLFSNYLFGEAKVGQLLRMEGPLGSFFVRDTLLPIIFLAGGTGFAPVKAMVEQLIAANSQRNIYVYWGVNFRDGLYSDIPDKWIEQGVINKYTPVLSGEEWEGKKGLVHEIVLKDFEDLGAYEVYACGSSAMIDVARSDFISKGLLGKNFHSDAFVSSE